MSASESTPLLPTTSSSNASRSKSWWSSLSTSTAATAQQPSAAATTARTSNPSIPATLSAPVPPTRIEPKVYFANERTFLSWLHFCVVLGGLALGLMNFGDEVGKMAGLAFTIVAMIFLAYSLYLFQWRARIIRRREPTPLDDLVGPFFVVSVIFLAVGINFYLKFFKDASPDNPKARSTEKIALQKLAPTSSNQSAGSPSSHAAKWATSKPPPSQPAPTTASAASPSSPSQLTSAQVTHLNPSPPIKPDTASSVGGGGGGGGGAALIVDDISPIPSTSPSAEPTPSAGEPTPTGATSTTSASQQPKTSFFFRQPQQQQPPEKVPVTKVKRVKQTGKAVVVASAANGGDGEGGEEAGGEEEVVSPAVVGGMAESSKTGGTEETRPAQTSSVAAVKDEDEDDGIEIELDLSALDSARGGKPTEEEQDGGPPKAMTAFGDPNHVNGIRDLLVKSKVNKEKKQYQQSQEQAGKPSTAAAGDDKKVKGGVVVVKANNNQAAMARGESVGEISVSSASIDEVGVGGDDVVVQPASPSRNPIATSDPKLAGTVRSTSNPSSNPTTDFAGAHPFGLDD